MSGIAGIVRLDGAPVASGEIEAMLAAMSRRGPDRQRGWSTGNAALGQVLLATTPESLAEVQPWVHPESGCVVVSDSRLDNRQELMRTLGMVHDDPDEIGDGVLLHAAFQRWGERCAESLLGDFAFVIWDPRNQRVFCARDVMGVRPFYFHFAPGRLFAFASVVDALLCVRDVPSRLNEGRVADFFVPRLEGIDKTSTFYEDIFRMPPAHTMSLANGRLHESEYWTPITGQPSDLPATEGDWIEGLHDLLCVAVRCRLRANVGVGSMLSGGLDSSSIVAIASRQMAAEGRGRLATFSGVSTEPDCPESRAIKTMLEHFDLASTQFDPDSIPEMLDAMGLTRATAGEPFDGSMTLIDCQYRAAAAQGVRVVLDGSDADTLLSEDDVLVSLLRRGRWFQLYRETRGLALFHGVGVTPWTLLRPVVSEALVPEPVRRVVRKIRSSYRPTHPFDSSMIDPAFARRIDLDSRLAKMAENLARARQSSPDGRATTWMSSSHTTAGIERYGRVGSAHAIEPRHPFADRRLIEYCARLPKDLRLRDGWPKWVLRTALTGQLPHTVAWRRDKDHLGWRFNRKLMDRMEAEILARLGDEGTPLRRYVDPGKLDRAINTQRNGTAGKWAWQDLLELGFLDAWLTGRPR